MRITFTSPGSRHGAASGMTLVEVLVALGILAAVAVIFLLGMSTASKGAIVSNESVTVDSLAKSQMESIMASSYKIPPSQTYTKIAIPQELVDQGYDIVITLGNAPGHIADDGLQEVTVDITRDGEIVFTLKGLKMNKLL